MKDLIITVYDKKPEKMDKFISSVEFRGLRTSDLLFLEDICRRTRKNLSVSHLENEDQ